jgi:hypothetical protein
MVRTLVRILAYTLAGMLGAFALVYGMDHLSLVYQIPKREPFDTIRVDQLYAIPNKWNEVDWSRGDPVMERCVNALLPHFGSRPCWYVRRDTMHVNQL